MGVGSTSHVPHKISLQTTESLGLEKDRFVRYVDCKYKELIVAVELPYKLHLLYCLYSIFPLSPLSTPLARDKSDYSADWQRLLQIPWCSFQKPLILA